MSKPTACANCLCCESIKDSDTTWHTICCLTEKTLDSVKKWREIDKDCPLPKEETNGSDN